MSLTRQQFIDVWTQLDALYVEISNAPHNEAGASALFGDYADDTDFTRSGSTSALVAAGTGNYAAFAAAMGDGVTQVNLGQAALAVNLAFIELADDYVAYLQAGGEPILEIAKLRGPGDPGQSYHDNILGNLNSGAFGTRFPDADYDLNGDNYVMDDIVSSATAEFHARPLYSGTANQAAIKNAGVAFDLAHDVSFASGMLDAYEQGFEDSAASFLVYGSGSVGRVASGSDGVTSFEGGYHGVVSGSVYTRFDGYRTDFGEGYTTKIAIYLDPSIALGEGFDYSVASNQTTNVHQRDFIFHVTKDSGTGQLLIGASNNSNAPAVREDLDTLPNNAEVTAAGWYTFEHYFFETADGSLAVAMSVYDDAGNLVFNQISNSPSDIVDSNVGGNRYGWFTVNTVTGGLRIDGVSVELTEPIGALIYDSAEPAPHTIEGSPFDDTFLAGPGNDQIDGNGGSDTYDASATTSGIVVDLDDNPFSGSVSGDGFAFGSGVGIDGLTSIENVRGGAGEDVVNGSAADNTFFASGGDDSYDGDDGVDTYDASELTGSVNVNLGAASNQAVKSTGGTDTLTDVENVVGTDFGDTITGNAGVNTLEGGGGDDTLTGGAGGDHIDGGSGSDNAVYTENLADAAISYNDTTGEWNVAVASGSDTLTGVERLDFGDGHSVYLVGGGSELTFEAAAALAQDGDAIYLSAGTHNISAQVVLGNDIDIVGAGQSDTVLHIGFNTATSGDARGAILINAGADVGISNLTLDGEGQTVWQGIRNAGDLDVTSVTFQEIKYNPSSTYHGTAIAVLPGATIDVQSSHFEEIGRIGVHLFGTATMSNSTYVGKGDGNWLDYALDIGGGGTATLTGNNISGNTGIAESDDSTSAGVLVSTLYGSGSALTLTSGNDFSDNSTSVYSGFNNTDTSTVDFGTGNTYGGDDIVIVGNGTYSNTETQDARFNWNGGDAANATGDQAISGAAQPDDLSGGGGDDVITGGGGNDIIDGGEGGETAVGDTAQYAADLSASDIVFDTDHWEVSAGAEGTDTLTNVERVVDGNGETFLLVGAGGYATIQDAIDAATAGDTVLIADDTYTEDVTLKDGVNVIGQSESGVVIQGIVTTPATFTNATISGFTVNNVGDDMLLDMTGTTVVTDVVFHDVTFALAADFTGYVAIGNGQSVPAMVLSDGADADNAGLTFRDVTMATNNFLAGTTAFVYTTFNGAAPMVIDGVTLSGTAAPMGTTSALGAQWNMTNQGGTAHVEIKDSDTLGGGNYYISGLQSVSATGNTFNGQGMALNGVKEATVTGNTFKNIDGSISANGVDGDQHRGLVIEDAWGTTGIENITVTGNTFENISAPDGAIAFQRFTDGSPANTGDIGRLSDVLIEGNTFTNAPVEPIFINDAYFGAGAVLPDSITQSQVIIGTAGDDTVVDSSTGDMAIFTGTGDDIITGGADNDFIDGGEGGETLGDTAVYADALEAGDIVASGASWTVTTDTQGVDTLVNVEQIDGGEAGKILLVGNGGYATIQAAITAADAGDTIVVAAGNYAENLSIDKALTIVGSGGAVTVTSGGAAAVSIAGDLNGGNVTFEGIDLVGAGAATGIVVAAGADVGTLTFTDGDISGFTSRGIFMTDYSGVNRLDTLAKIVVSDATFSANGTGSGNTAHVKLYGFSGEAVFEDVVLEGAATNRPDSAIEITGALAQENQAHPVPAGAPAANIKMEDVTVTGGYDKNPIALYHFASIDGPVGPGLPGVAITNLDLSAAESGWGPLFNVDGIADASIDASAFDVIFPASPAGGVHAEIQGEEDDQGEIDTVITGTDANDSLHGKGGNDTLNGGDGDDRLYGGNKPGQPFENGEGNDTLNGEAGDDLLVGGLGDDILNGGADNDTLNGGADSDAIDGGAGDDTIVYAAASEFGATESVDGGDDTDTILFNGTGTESLTLHDVTNVENVDLGGSDDIGVDASLVDNDGTDTGLTFNGNAGANTIIGTADDDTINGGDGNDTITGGAGEDNIDGGAGIDTAVYAASSTDATIDFNGGNWEITIGGETDVLTGIERVTFTGDSKDFLLIGGGSEFNLNDAVAAADASGGDTIWIGDGDYNSGGSQVVIDRDVAIKGQGRTTTTLNADFDTAASGGVDAGAWLLVQAGKTLTISDLTLDGTGQTVGAAIRVTGAGATADVDSVGFNEIKSGGWDGRGIAAMDGGHVDVEDSVFTNIGRIGVHFRDDTTGSVSNSTYTGKGPGNHLDYGVELGAGAVATLTGNTITGNTGEAVSDGSTSAAVLVTTYFGAGTDATLNGNVFTGNTNSVAAGYDENDTSTVDFGTGNTYGNDIVIIGNGTYENTETVSAKFDWQGGSAANAVGDNAISGGTAGDELNGGEGADEILGNDGNDTIKGEGGNDTITGGAGDDNIDGGAGIDTAVFAGAFADYEVNVATMQVTHTASGDVDEIANIEIFEFSGSGERILFVGGDTGQGFATIQAALDVAEPNDVVFVLPKAGGYNESLTIYDNGVQLIGGTDEAGPMPVVINGLDGQAAITIADGVTGVYVGTDAPGGDISNSFVINAGSGVGSVGLHVGTGSSASILDNVISGSSDSVLINLESDGSTVEGNSLSGADVAIQSAGSTTYVEQELADDNSFAPGWVHIEGVDKVFTSIQAAIDAASANDIIHVGPGTFNENLSITTEGISIVGEPGAILMGTLVTTPAWDGVDPLDEFLETSHATFTGTTGLTIGADDVSISGMQFSGFAVGISLGSSDGVSVTGNDFISNITGIRKPTASEVTDVTISGNDFSQGINGMTIYAASNGDGSFDGVTMDNNTFSNLSVKGMYFEQLSNAEFNGNTFDDVGNYGLTNGASEGKFGQAIDINLKYQTYSNVVFNGTIIEDSGNSDKSGTAAGPDASGAAIGVKIRDDGSYAGMPASFTGQIEFNGGSIDGTSTGFRIGEPGKDNDGPNVLINGVLIENATESEVDNATDPASGGVATVNMAAGQGTLDASASIAAVEITGTADADTATTGTGDDSFEGLAGDDTFNGGDGTDTLVLNGDIGDYSIDLSAGTVVDDVAGDGDEGEDTFTDVEIIEFGTGGRVLIVGAGGFDTLQEAVDAAQAGDTIMLSDGLLTEDVTIGAHLTGVRIIGAQEGVAVGGRDLANGIGESTIDGRIVVLADNVVIDGIRILDGSSGGSFENAGIHVQADDVTVKNSLFFNAAGGVAGTSRGIINSVGSGNGLMVMNNAFMGWATGVYVQNTSDVTVSGNAFNANFVGMSADAYAGNANLLVSGNTFTDQNLEGMGIGAAGGSWETSSITGNTFTGPGIFNYDPALDLATVTGNTFNGTTGADTLTDDSTGSGRIGSNTLDGLGDSDTADYAFDTAGITATLGGTATGTAIGTDTLTSIENITTGSGNDAITGSAADNVINTGGGDDTVTYAVGASGGGDDTVDMGAGTGDTLIVDGTGAAGGQQYAVAPGSLDVAITGAATGSIDADGVEKLTLNLGAHGDTVTLTGDLTTTGLGTAKAGNLINGGVGNDVVDASGLTSATGLTLALGDGDDTVKMGRGNDTLGGGAGDRDLIDLSHITTNTVVNLTSGTASGSDVGSDTITGFEDIRGGAGKDFLTGNGVANIFYASAGDDVIDGKGGTDTYDASGTAGPVTIDLDTGFASSAGGTPTLTSIENALGGLGDDFIYGSSVANRLEGGAGNDQISGGAGSDTIIGGAGDTDIALFSGDRQDYVVNVSKLFGVSTVTVTHTATGDVDTLTGIEYMRFDNGVTNVTVEVDSVLDFNMNTSADVFYQNGAGTYLYRDGSGSAPAVNLGSASGTTYIAAGDFNGDGIDDFLVRNDVSGSYSYMNGGITASPVAVGTIPGRTPIAIADFDGDGKDDIILRDNVNTSWVSYLSGASPSGTPIGSIAGREIIGVADFNGDGREDLLLQDTTTGWLSYASKNAAGSTVYTSIGSFAGRDVLAIADFDGDGKADFLLEDQVTGWLTAREADGSLTTTIGFLSGRELIGIGDFNGDGKDDLLTRELTTNWVAFKSGGGGAVEGRGFLGATQTIVDIADYSGDGRDDLLLFNSVSNQANVAVSGLMNDLTGLGDFGGQTFLQSDIGLDYGDDLLIA